MNAMLQQGFSDRMAAAQPQLHDQFVSNVIGRRIWCTSSYSGMGCVEAIAKPIESAARHKSVAYADTAGFLMWSSSDISPLARKALLAHEEPTRPTHLFGDVVDRIKQPWRDQARGMQTSFLPVLPARGAGRFVARSGWRRLRVLEQYAPRSYPERMVTRIDVAVPHVVALASAIGRPNVAVGVRQPV